MSRCEDGEQDDFEDDQHDELDDNEGDQRDQHDDNEADRHGERLPILRTESVSMKKCSIYRTSSTPAKLNRFERNDKKGKQSMIYSKKY